ncbi:alkaline phosphatase D family protein [Actinomadura gamaensis]|uniref:Alkaline phosphatase D family protein n=1 Tax=Actinomadura gamaensis TaxID=1763541 RepID=A0ABV9U6Q4_9ACTN
MPEAPHTAASSPLARAVGRRSLLVGSLALGAAGALTVPAAAAPARPGRRLPGDPFTLGVASGDPDHDGFVLWTRLAVDPHAAGGLGGMPSRTFRVEWQVAADDRFRRIVRHGVAQARPQSAHSVHVELSGLPAGREYWYRFRVDGHVSPAGRTRTAPHPFSFGEPLTMGFVSCSQFEHGYFTSYRRLAEDEPDLILHLGDYQYEYKKGDYTIPGGNPRDHEGPETVSLADYRHRYAQYRSDPDLRAAHAAAPWLVVFDDHEVENNWAGTVPEEGSDTPSTAAFLKRRAAAFQAYYENMPLRRTSLPHGPGMQLYRRIRWGRLANFHMLDTRQFRDDQACGDGYKNCAAADDPSRTITGGVQEKWLIEGFRRSAARWDILGQQVFFGQRDRDAGPLKVTSMDAWDGYTASRERITRGWVDARVRNAVVLTGDVHAHWAGDLELDYDDPSARPVGSELVCSSVTTGGDGADGDGTHPWFKHNPALKFYSNQRGYVLTRIDRAQMKADFKTVPTVRTPGAAASTKATYVIEDRVPGLHQTYLRPYTKPGTLTATPDLDRQTVEAETAP